MPPPQAVPAAQPSPSATPALTAKLAPPKAPRKLKPTSDTIEVSKVPRAKQDSTRTTKSQASTRTPTQAEALPSQAMRPSGPTGTSKKAQPFDLEEEEHDSRSEPHHSRVIQA